MLFVKAEFSVKGIFNEIGDFFENVGDMILSLLPDSPFQSILSGIAQNEVVSDILGYANKILPISEACAAMTVWLVSIGIFYAYQALLRWTNNID